MKVKELKKYLERFEEDEFIRFIVSDLKNRLAWTNEQIGMIAITALTFPVIGLELYESESMDDEMVQTIEEYKQNNM